MAATNPHSRNRTSGLSSSGCSLECAANQLATLMQSCGCVLRSERVGCSGKHLLADPFHNPDAILVESRPEKKTNPQKSPKGLQWQTSKFQQIRIGVKEEAKAGCCTWLWMAFVMTAMMKTEEKDRKLR